MAVLSEGWRERPPVQWMVQAYLGIKPRTKEEEYAEFDELVNSLKPTPTPPETT